MARLPAERYSRSANARDLRVPVARRELPRSRCGPRYACAVAKKKQNVRARTEVRELARKREKLYEARSKLALLEPGGSPERPLELVSSSLVEVRAEAEPCLRCGESARCEEHTALATGHGVLRVAHLRCPRCAAKRLLYFRILPSALH